MADVRNCKNCGKIFNYIGGSVICPICRQHEEEDFKRVKEYLYDHPGASINQVSVELDIKIELLKKYLREGRLEIVGGGANMLLECERCGKSINSGRYCNECERELSGSLKSAAEQISRQLGKQAPESAKTDKGVGMRYLNKYQK